MVLNRQREGVFDDLTDFCNRVEVESSQLELLIRIGAFRFTGKTKAELLWEKNAVFNPRLRREPSLDLFVRTAPDHDFRLDETPNHRPGHHLSSAEFDQAFDELELLGFPLCSPFWLIPPASSAEFSGTAGVRPPSAYQHQQQQSAGPIRVRSPGEQQPPPHPLQHIREGGSYQLHAYFVCDKVVPTVKGERMSFGCWLTERGQYFDSVHFPDVYQRYPLRGNGVYRLRGRVTREFDFPVLEVRELERLPYLKDLRFTD